MLRKNAALATGGSVNSRFRCLALLLFSVLGLVPLAATPGGPFGMDSGWLGIGSTNDLFGGELPLNRDDWRSYGGWIAMALPWGLQASVDYYGLTNRATNARADELSLIMSLQRSFHSSFGNIHLIPSLGLRLSGNLGGKEVQNTVHRIFGIRQVTLDYAIADDGASLVSEFLAGVSLDYEYPIHIARGLQFVPSVRAQCEYALPAGFLLSGGPRISLRSDGGDRIALSAFWAENYQQNPISCINTILAKETGLGIGYVLQTGFLRYEARIHPTNNFANGSISIILNKPAKKSDDNVPVRFGSTDIIFEYSMDALNWLKQTRVSLPLRSMEWIPFGVGAGVLSVLPTLDYSYGDAHPDDALPGQRLRVTQLAPGFQLVYSSPWKWLPLQVFAGLDVGARLEQLWILPDTVQPVLGPLFQVNAGLKIGPFALCPSSGLFPPRDRYGLLLNYSLIYCPSADMRVHWQHRVSAGLVVYCDWVD